MRRRQKIVFIVSAGIFFMTSIVYPQSYITSNPSQIYDVQSAFINPAIISYQNPQFTVGTKVLQYGFLDNDQFASKFSYASIVLPKLHRLNLTAGLQGTSLSFPIYSENIISLLSSFRPANEFSIGVQLGVLSKSFNQDKFDLVDEGDPVFANGNSKNVFNLGVGIFAQPVSNIRLGLGISHVNEPNISFIDDDVKQPMVINGSFSYSLGFWQSSQWEISSGFKMVDNEFFPVFSVLAQPRSFGIVQINYSKYETEFQTQIYAHDNISFDYKLSYPLSEIHKYSNFSHQISLVYRFQGETKFEVSSLINSMDIQKKQFLRHVDREVSESELAGVKKNEFSTIRSERVQVESILEFRPYINYYRELLQLLSNEIHRDTNSKIHIVISPGQERVAKALVDFSVDSLHVPSGQIEYGYNTAGKDDNMNISKTPLNNKEISLSENSILFNVLPLLSGSKNSTLDVQKWRFIILDQDNELVKQFNGRKQIPHHIAWNWFDDAGRLIDPGVYYYVLAWVDINGKVLLTDKRKLYINKSSMKRALNVSKELPALDKGTKIFELVLGAF
ncbi:type IX secretion system membrane protein PorP/SprF [candidate division KSB1 bacterium]|nr:type IX secretion system membrane protein PorP/SprF [candidate division KSB1 bacterium]